MLNSINIETPFYIYRHIRPDTNEVFYIGKGYILSKGHSFRATEKSHRNKWWRRIVKKNNGKFISQIIFQCKTEKECNEKEIEFISLYGRKNLKKGTLVNLTDGSDGSIGIIVSEKTRKKLSDKFSGENHPNWGKKLSKETCEKKSESMKKSPRNLKGKKLPDSWVNNLRKSKMGEKNPMFNKTGSKHHNSKKVINVETGEIFDSIKLAEESINMKYRSLNAYLDGKLKRNKTPFIYYEIFKKITKEEALKLIKQVPIGLKNSQ